MITTAFFQSHFHFILCFKTKGVFLTIAIFVLILSNLAFKVVIKMINIHNDLEIHILISLVMFLIS